jgi:hypothetical protein
MKKTIRAVLALGLSLGAFACGDDNGSDDFTPAPTPVGINLAGRWSSSTMWLTQYTRTRDAYNGSYTCPGSMTITQGAGDRTFTGFAVVSAPCPANSFDLSGTVDAEGAVTISMGAPRPGAGTCPQPPVSTYSGLVTGNNMSARAQARVQCPGELEGEYTFNYILSAQHFN